MSIAESIRHAGRAELREALLDARATSLKLWQSYEAALGKSLIVPQRPDLNPPLWELGHLAWFQEWFISRNTDIMSGHRSRHVKPMQQSVLPLADALFDSSTVPHRTRWSLPLPQPETIRDYLDVVLQTTLSLLARCPETDDALYFYRLVLAHEDMHAEAFRYMARGLGFAADAMPELQRVAPEHLQIAAGFLTAGSSAQGFSFDNERRAHRVKLGAFEIDSAPVTVAQFNAFCEARRRKPIEGLADTAAAHLTHAQASAYCAWAQRRLPTEFEWQAAAAHPDFVWGDVWEWTASVFAPFNRFEPDPYKDYSEPWFDGQHIVLKGGSAYTHPRMKHLAYRNFFLTHRNDVRTGFRTCAS